MRRNWEELGARHRLGAEGQGERRLRKVTLKKRWYNELSKGDLRLDQVENSDKPMPDTNSQPLVTRDYTVPESEDAVAVMFVPRTPQRKLLQELRKCETDIQKVLGRKVRMVERAGVKLEHILSRKNSWMKMLSRWMGLVVSVRCAERGRR